MGSKIFFGSNPLIATLDFFVLCRIFIKKDIRQWLAQNVGWFPQR